MKNEEEIKETIRKILNFESFLDDYFNAPECYSEHKKELIVEELTRLEEKLKKLRSQK